MKAAPDNHSNCIITSLLCYDIVTIQTIHDSDVPSRFLPPLGSSHARFADMVGDHGPHICPIRAAAHRGEAHEACMRSVCGSPALSHPTAHVAESHRIDKLPYHQHCLPCFEAPQIATPDAIFASCASKCACSPPSHPPRPLQHL